MFVWQNLLILCFYPIWMQLTEDAGMYVFEQWTQMLLLLVFRFSTNFRHLFEPNYYYYFTGTWHRSKFLWRNCTCTKWLVSFSSGRMIVWLPVRREPEKLLLILKVRSTEKKWFDVKETHRLESCSEFFETINDFNPQEWRGWYEERLCCCDWHY